MAPLGTRAYLVSRSALALAGCGLLIASCGRAPASSTAGAAEAVVDTAATEAAHEASAAPPAADHDPDPRYETFLAALHDVEVPARVAGQVVALEVEEGARVEAGQPLARIDDRERRANLDEQEARAARAESEWQRAERLNQDQLLSEQERVAAHSDWEIARAQRDRAKLEWEWCTVRAPIAGFVAERRTQVGRTVREGDALFRVSDPRWLRAELLLPQSLFGSVHAGQRVRLVPAAGAAPITVPITRVAPLVDPASGAFRVTVDVDNRSAHIPAGIAVRVEIQPAAH